MLDWAFKGSSKSFDFLGKLIFSVFTLRVKVQGDEVSFILEMGTTLGVTLGYLFYLPVGFIAGLRIIRIFTEFSYENAACLFLICVVIYIFFSNLGIYFSQEKTIIKGFLFSVIH